MLVASHRFPARFYPIIISCTYFGFGFEAGFQCLCPVCADRERVAAPGALLSHFWKHWLVEVSTCESEQRAEPKMEQLLLEFSVCRQLVGLVDMCYFPMDQL